MAQTEQERGWRIGGARAVRGVHRPRPYRYFRSLRTGGIKRAILAVSGTLRGEKVPPEYYDDINRAACGDRNWKQFRRTRWKVLPCLFS